MFQGDDRSLRQRLEKVRWVQAVNSEELRLPSPCRVRWWNAPAGEPMATPDMLVVTPVGLIMTLTYRATAQRQVGDFPQHSWLCSPSIPPWRTPTVGFPWFSWHGPFLGTAVHWQHKDSRFLESCSIWFGLLAATWWFSAVFKQPDPEG